MRELSFPGGSYCEAQPNGEWAVLFVDAHVRNGRGIIPLKNGMNPLYMRLSPDGTKVAGQGHDTGLALLWTSTGWQTLEPAHGVSPVAFWPDGRLEVSTPEKGYGSQGIRWLEFVDGDPTKPLVHTGDATYASSFGLHEYTQYGEIAIGQGSHNGGVTLVWGNLRKRLGDGLCYFVRYNRMGDDLAVAWWEKVGNSTTAFLRWFTVNEIAGMRDDVIAEPVPPPPPPPPEPTPMPVPNLFSIVQETWTKYNGQNRGAMVNEIAWRGNGNSSNGPWGLSRKRGGANVVQPQTGELVAHDVVQYGPTAPDGKATMFDVFTDLGPIWGEAHQHNQPERIWLPAVQPDGVVEPVPEPDPSPDLEDRVKAIEDSIKLLATTLREVSASISSLRADVAAIRIPDTSNFVTKDALSNLKVSGETSKNAWHTHRINLKVEV